MTHLPNRMSAISFRAAFLLVLFVLAPQYVAGQARMPRNRQARRLPQQNQQTNPQAFNQAAPRQTFPQKPPPNSAAPKPSPVATDPVPTSEATDSTTPLSWEQVESTFQQLMAATEDAELKQELIDRLKSIKTMLARRDEFIAREKEFTANTQGITQRVAELQKELDSLTKQQPRLPRINSPAELEVLATQLGQQVVKLKTDVETRQARIASHPAQRNEIRERISSVENDLATLKKENASQPVLGESNQESTARQFELLARRQLLVSELPALNSELAWMDARASVGYSTIELDVLARQLALATEESRLANDAVQAARAQVAEEVAEKARQDAIQVSPALQSLAHRNSELADANQALPIAIAAADKELKRVTAIHDELTRDFESIRKKVDTVGLPASVGAMLRKQRMTMPRLRQLNTEVDLRQESLNELHLKLFDLKEERTTLSDLNGHAQTLVDSLPPSSNPEAAPSRDRLLAETVTLLEQRRDILDPYLRAEVTLFDTLGETSVVQQDLAHDIEEFSEYIDQRVLWIRSANPVGMQARSDLESGLRWTRPEPWRNVATVIQNDFQRHRIIYFLVAALCSLFILATRSLRKTIKRLGEQAKRSNCKSLAPTIRAIMITFALTSRLAIPLAFFAWRLRAGSANEDSVFLGTAISHSAKVFFALEFFRNIVRPLGLGDAHFDWSDRAVRLLRRHIRWFLPIATLLGGMTFMLVGGDSVRGPGNIERLFFLVICGLVSWFFYRTMHPKTGIPATYLVAHAGGWMDRLQSVWFALLVASPLALAGLSAAGYVYTANQLAWRVFSTIAILALAFLLESLIARVLLVARRAAAIEQAQERRRQAAEREAETSQLASDPLNVESTAKKTLVDEVAEKQDPLEDLRAQSHQARRLTVAMITIATIAAIWFAWHDVTPALGFLENWPLWNSTKTVSEMVAVDGGLTERQTREVNDPVTIAELVLAAVALCISFVAARDLPGLAEITVLNRLPIEKSVRYAITTIISYLIVLLGVIVAFNLIGLHWHQVQWMATALTFGLAFGLQEMFANFVAGIIILFERPVRVGDIVTLDGVSGVVSRVRIRATTITNWDRQDFIVPNKDFITGRVLNWTLSDYVNRIVVKVGVDYGSDIEKTKQLMLEAAKEHPVIADEPEPIVTFEEFGESSLQFVLRCYLAIKDMPSRLAVVDGLHTTIDQKFREAGIEIAFPQQVVHHRTTSGSANIQFGKAESAEKPSNGSIVEQPPTTSPAS